MTSNSTDFKEEDSWDKVFKKLDPATRHWCDEWDYMPIDKNSREWGRNEICRCGYPHMI